MTLAGLRSAQGRNSFACNVKLRWFLADATQVGDPLEGAFGLQAMLSVTPPEFHTMQT